MKSVIVIEFENDDNTTPPEMWASWQQTLGVVKAALEDAEVKGYRNAHVAIREAAEAVLATFPHLTKEPDGT